MMSEEPDVQIACNFWSLFGGMREALSELQFVGEFQGLPSQYRVAPLASASVGVATLAVANVLRLRNALPSFPKVRIDRTHACASFLCDQLAKPVGWKFEDDLQDFTGNYEAEDGWIRIHTMYHHHHKAALSVLKCFSSRESVTAQVRKWKARILESAIVSSGGCAAELRSAPDWDSHPQGLAIKEEPLATFSGVGSATRRILSVPVIQGSLPLQGLRVLDLTRVLAGPIGARFLAAYGADVVRIDPEGFSEPHALLVETMRGKRSLSLNLKNDAQMNDFVELLRSCDVLIHGFRPGAMENLGLSLESISQLNPSLVVVRHNAYGWTGPWSDRRGFDSLVQMSSGIAFDSKGARPTPLPAQALDYATGFLIATSACMGLAAKYQETRLSLAATANFLQNLGKQNDLSMKPFQNLEKFSSENQSEWGPVYQLNCPGSIENFIPIWRSPATRLGASQKIMWYE